MRRNGVVKRVTLQSLHVHLERVVLGVSLPEPGIMLFWAVWEHVQLNGT